MNVRTLITQLQALPPDAEVYLSIDSEGNEYKPIAEAARLANLVIEVDPKRPWMTECYQNEDDQDFPLEEQSVVIWPVN